MFVVVRVSETCLSIVSQVVAVCGFNLCFWCCWCCSCGRLWVLVVSVDDAFVGDGHVISQADRFALPDKSLYSRGGFVFWLVGRVICWI